MLGAEMWNFQVLLGAWLDRLCHRCCMLGWAHNSPAGEFVNTALRVKGTGLDNVQRQLKWKFILKIHYLRNSNSKAIIRSIQKIRQMCPIRQHRRGNIRGIFFPWFWGWDFERCEHCPIWRKCDSPSKEHQ